MSVSIEDKQKSLYAALVRYSSDAQSLRERSMDHLVVIGLQDTNSDNAVRAGELRIIIGRGIGTGGIRIDHVQSSLDRLIKKGLVETRTLHYKPHYYLNQNGRAELNVLSSASQELLIPCVNRVLLNFDDRIDRTSLFEATKKFIINCFVDYGHRLAECVIGEAQHSEIHKIINVEKTFSKSFGGIKLNDDERENLYSRCYGFIKSQEKSDIEVKFLLTQAYYLAKVLEIDGSDFDPLTKSSFSGANIYLDTNVVFESFFDHQDNKYFDELVSVADKLGMKLCLTQATIDEVNRVLRNKVPALQRIFSSVPEQLYRNTEDHIIQGYIGYLEKNHNADPEKYIKSLGDIRERMEKNGVSYVEMDIGLDFDGRELEELSKIVDMVAADSRGFGKSEQVSKHDAAHLIQIKKIRASGGKAWFLTQDKTLGDQRLKLGNKKPLFFSLSSFVQCISPFAQDAKADSLFYLFERVLEDDVSLRGVGRLFEMSELQIISEYHKDILTTEPEKLNVAFEYVKSRLLNGHEITEKNQHKVSLEIKKFLRCSADEQKAAMAREIARKAEEITAARDALSEKEKLEADLADKNRNLEVMLEHAAKRSSAERRMRLTLSIFIAIFGLLISFLLITIAPEISNAVTSSSIPKYLVPGSLETLIRVVGAVMFTAFLVPLSLCFQKNIKIWILTISASLSVYFCQLFEEQILSSLLTYIGVGSLVAGLICWLPNKNKG